MAVTADKPAPYAPARAILDLIDRYRERGLASPINSDVLARAGIPLSLIPRTLQALQTLDLIDENGMPTQTFEGIRLAPADEFKRRLEDWLKGTYADVFSYVDPSKDDETRIRDAFRTYQPIGQQSRMVSLFQGLCAAAGLLPEKTVRQSTRLGAASIAADPRLRDARAGARKLVSERLVHTKPARSAPAAGAGDLPPALAGLLASLPSPEDGWTTAERDRFMTTFEAVLDYSIPIKEEPMQAAEAKKASAA